MKILGVETSCDETAIAIVEGKRILANIVSSQSEIHAPFGGVVPEIASRHHIENIPLVLDEALHQADLDLTQIDGVAATYAPGLLGALLVGLQYGKSLAFALNKPFVGVNHLEAHINSVFLENKEVTYPFLALTVSGGHTHLFLVKEFGRYELLGGTRDDACGEAYDKVAKLLGLGYPGGPLIDKRAPLGNPKAFRFTKPKLKGVFDFSFSGIKTACLLEVQKQNGKLSENFINDMSASFQSAAIGFLIDRLVFASRQLKIRNWVVCGGVSANQGLRKTLEIVSKENDCRYFIPSIPLCTDNGAMIAYVGGRYLESGKHSPFSLNAQACSELSS